MISVMHPNPPAANPQTSPRRSVFVTVLAWTIIVVSGLLIPISVISLLMILVGSYGTSNVDPFGFLLIVVAPAASLVGGIGLLRRKAWARYYVIGLLGLLIVFNALDLMTARQETTTYTSESGVTTTIPTSYGSNYHQLPIVAICALLLVGLFWRSVRDEFRGSRRAAMPASPGKVAALPLPMQMPVEPAAPLDTGRDWRVGHQGRDRMYYEESHSGGWQRIDIDGEMLTGRAHHVIYFASPEEWQRYPEWARHRRDEIIARIKSEFRPPDYDYHEDIAGHSAMPAGKPAIVPPRPAAATTPRATVKQQSALLLVIVLLVAITAGMGWLVTRGLGSGTTYFPAKRASQQRTVTRQHEPATFWLSIGVYSAVGLGTGGMALWCISQARRRNP